MIETTAITLSEPMVGGKALPAGQPLLVGRDEKLGLIGAASAVYKFEVPDSLPDEFSIYQKCSGIVAVFKYKKTKRT